MRKRKKKKAPKKSNFVLFFETLEKRGPLTPSRGPIYERWTKRVRREMTKAGTWPTLLQKPDIQIVAEYMSRLQAIFWRTIRRKPYRTDLEDVWGHDLEEWGRIKPYLNIFFLIHKKVRTKGMRNKIYLIAPRNYWHSPYWMWVCTDYRRTDDIDIRPWVEFNDHGAGI